MAAERRRQLAAAPQRTGSAAGGAACGRGQGTRVGGSGGGGPKRAQWRKRIWAEGEDNDKKGGARGVGGRKPMMARVTW
eukprot:635015-Pyramimonas_sp.AAC.1